MTDTAALAESSQKDFGLCCTHGSLASAPSSSGLRAYPCQNIECECVCVCVCVHAHVRVCVCVCTIWGVLSV